MAGTPRPLVVLGIGVNVSQQESDWPPDLAGRPRSLAGLGAPVARETLLAALLARLAAWYGVLLEDGLRAGARRLAPARPPRPPRPAAPTGEGTSVDLGPGGELVVRRDDGRSDRLVVPPASAAPNGQGSR